MKHATQGRQTGAPAHRTCDLVHIPSSLSVAECGVRHLHYGRTTIAVGSHNRGRSAEGRKTHRELRDMKGKGRTQGKGFSYVMALGMAALVIVAAKTVYDYRNGLVKGALADAR